MNRFVYQINKYIKRDIANITNRMKLRTKVDALCWKDIINTSGNANRVALLDKVSTKSNWPNLIPAELERERKIRFLNS